uniref:Uncharacterized protein n=1 Tax=Cucumis sativus TaxID=3659 RepID=A0A0A0L8K6_CUCSA
MASSSELENKRRRENFDPTEENEGARLAKWLGLGIGKLSKAAPSGSHISKRKIGTNRHQRPRDPLREGGYFKGNWIDKNLPSTKFESNLKFLSKQPPMTKRKYFYRVENTVTSKADNPILCETGDKEDS